MEVTIIPKEERFDIYSTSGLLTEENVCSYMQCTKNELRTMVANRVLQCCYLSSHTRRFYREYITSSDWQNALAKLRQSTLPVIQQPKSKHLGLNEFTFQNSLYRWRDKQRHKLITPNCKMFWGEADLVSVSQSDYIYEHEIKISKTDFKNDFKKSMKHNILSGKISRTEGNTAYYCPNYFVYVVPENLIAESDIPVYAGLVYLYDNFKTFVTVKKPPLLHKIKISEKQVKFLLERFYYKYWGNRLK